MGGFIGLWVDPGGQDVELFIDANNGQIVKTRYTG
jgi:hypothetical protein